MTIGAEGAPTALQDALRQLEQHGAASLPGRRSDTVLRWKRRRRVLTGTMLAMGGAGVLACIVGLALREVGVWALLIPIGFLLAFAGLLSGALTVLAGRLMAGRLRAEDQPVMIDPRGIALRGIGPIPWNWVGPPERRHVRVKNDIGGACTIMPLTPEGRAAVNAQAGWWMRFVGPKPYLRFDVPYLLLPGIAGLGENETLQLFRVAHERFGAGPGR
ncbi:hypothetical protein D3248_04575 [Leucobacter zeae]|nr:hypothetical protein [Leucobacter zeae]